MKKIRIIERERLLNHHIRESVTNGREYTIQTEAFQEGKAIGYYIQDNYGINCVISNDDIIDGYARIIDFSDMRVNGATSRGDKIKIVNNCVLHDVEFFNEFTNGEEHEIQGEAVKEGNVYGYYIYNNNGDLRLIERWELETGIVEYVSVNEEIEEIEKIEEVGSVSVKPEETNLPNPIYENPIKPEIRKYVFDYFKEVYGTDSNELESVYDLLVDIDNSKVKTPFIAGGAVRRTIQGLPLDTDIDLFFVSESHMKEYFELFKEKHGEMVIEDSIVENANNITLEIDTSKFDTMDENLDREDYYLRDKYKIQLITIYAKDMESTLKRFDFTISQFGYDGEYLYVGELSLYDLERKRLNFNVISRSNPVVTFRRILKYSQQGYYACSGLLSTFMKEYQNHPELLQSDVVYID